MVVLRTLHGTSSPDLPHDHDSDVSPSVQRVVNRSKHPQESETYIIWSYLPQKTTNIIIINNNTSTSTSASTSASKICCLQFLSRRCLYTAMLCPFLKPGALFDLPYIKGDFEDEPFQQVFGHWCCLGLFCKIEFAATIATAIFKNITFMHILKFAMYN